MKPLALIISCEHAVNTIPAAFSVLFHHHQHQLNSHLGIDFGALEIATYLSEQLPTRYYGKATVSRLLIDCNRSLHHRQCFSKHVQCLSDAEKNYLINTYYQPFRQSVIDAINPLINQHHRVLHLSIHSFTPVWQQRPRQADIGLLYHPQRAHERLFAGHWQRLLTQYAPELRVRLNYPYRGNTDSFTQTLRTVYSEHDYLAFEVETNQAICLSIEHRLHVSQALTHTVHELLHANSC